MSKPIEFLQGRIGKFTSSQIGNLCTNGRKQGEPGATFYSYVKKVAAERMFGARMLSQQSLPTRWGTVCETYVSELLEKEGNYTMGYSSLPIQHETLGDYWGGTPDGLTSNGIVEIKCPWSIDNYFTLFGIDEDTLKSEVPMYYYQCISNSILANKDFAELVVFYPSADNLLSILEKNRNESIDFGLEWRDIDDMPCLSEDNEHLRLYKLKWKVKQEDKDFLTERVRLAIKECEQLISEKLKLINNGK